MDKINIDKKAIYKENIEINLDENIIKYINETKKENKENGENEEGTNEDITSLINKIVYLIIKQQKIRIDNIYLSIQSVSNEEIRNLNKEYRGIDKVTDVLSFPVFEKEELDSLICEEVESKKIKELELGDIIICLDMVEKQSIEYKTGIKRELLYMITHGVCHLLGFDHIEEEDKIIMRKLEETILSKIGVCK
jgi:probable rRNA maturation factor